MVTSVEVLGPECVFLEGDIMRNKYWIGIIKFLGWACEVL